MSIRYQVGDATAPQADGPRIICHICNDIGGWGAGFVVALSRRWKEPERAYRDWYSAGEGFALGEVQFVNVEPGLWVANMVGQHGVGIRKGKAPIRYEAVRTALRKVATFAKAQGASVHMPRIGCGLSGGTWDQIEPLITDSLVAGGIEVFVYDFK